MAIRKKPLVVHLGNVGKDKAKRTRVFAKRFKTLDFIGIDLAKVQRTGHNWRQVQADFLEGLTKLEDNSAGMITSNMALGYYDKSGKQVINPKKEHIVNVRKTIKVCNRKLKPNGKLRILADEDLFFKVLLPAMTGLFKADKLKVRLLREEEYEKTAWLKEAKKEKIKTYEIVAQK